MNKKNSETPGDTAKIESDLVKISLKLTNEDWQKLLINMVDSGLVSVQVINSLLGGIRRETRDKLKQLTVVELTLEQSEVLELLRKQYQSMVNNLADMGISTEGIPLWFNLIDGLSKRKLNLAREFSEPAILLIPPIPLNQLIFIINEKLLKVKMPQIKLFKNCKSDHSYETLVNEKQWQVFVTDAVLEVPQETKIYSPEKSNLELISEWLKLLQNQGFEAMNDARTYLILAIKRGLLEGKLIDHLGYTVLNPYTYKQDNYVARGLTQFNQVKFNCDVTAENYPDLRLRKIIPIEY